MIIRVEKKLMIIRGSFMLIHVERSARIAGVSPQPCRPQR